MNAGEGTTVIGKSVKIVGDLSGSEDLFLDGELEGTIQLSAARLTIGAAARVRADIVAQNIIIFGRVEGDIRCPGRVELRSTALVQGNIYAAGFSIEENAAFRGAVDPSRAQEPLPVAPIAGAAVTRSESGNIGSGLPRTAQMPAALAAAAARPLGTITTNDEHNESTAPPVLFADIQS